MKRKQFIQSAALGIGAMSISPVVSAYNTKHDSIFFDANVNPKIIKKGEGEKQVVLGDHQTLKLTGRDTNGLYTLIELYNEPGVEIPMHVHANEDEVFQVLTGELEIKVGKKTKLLKAGDIGFCPRGIPHSWKVVGNDKAKVMLSIFPAGLENMFREFAEFPPGPPDSAKLGEICKKYKLQFV
jgi:quercetin dioxygenase-like cupin family protein